MDFAAAAAGSSVRPCKYDVFLSFRGEDTRNNFVSHLQRGLVEKGIHTFVDPLHLERGDSISEEISTAIDESRLSVVVFSQNYTSSRWCLDELVHILGCMETQKQIVVPIFYQVQPSQIRNFEIEHTAFHKPEDDSDTEMEDEQVQRWRSAVETAAQISGWDSRDYGNDAKLIVEFTDYISNILFNISSSKANVLVEMDSHIGNMNALLCTGADDVRVVGVWGMGGIGKTTIARAVYDKISSQFEACCFLKNVKEGFQINGLVHMQKDLSGILKENVRSLGGTERGSKAIMESVRRKVLIVLDDVDNSTQIEILLGNLHSFGNGSRIIITSRDKHVLVSSGVNLIYEPKLLSYYGALEIFKEHAFRRNQPTKDHHLLLSRAIEYAQGLPLALKVLGALLNDRSVREWEDVLEKVKNMPHIGIQGVLKTSFEGLEDLEKEIFLDIACFFRGMHKEYATKVMDSCGFLPHIGLRVLVDRALVTISADDTLEMHDLIKEMGCEIVRQESIEEPGRRSRLWLHEDIFHILTEKAATKAVESITLDLWNKQCMIDPEAFVKMKNLRLFRLKGRYQSIRYRDRDISHMESTFPSRKLSCLIWHGCPLTSPPVNFHAKHLVDLDLQYSRFQQLWVGTKRMTKLAFIDLSHCQYLEKTPDFSGVKNLQKLVLDDCVSLLEVHPSISFLESLEYFSLKGCKELTIFPSRIFMKSLKTLYLSGCSKLEKFPEIVDTMGKLSELDLGGTAIEELPSSIENLTGLVTLSLKDCRQLTRLPGTIIQLKSLTQVILSGCTKLVEFENPGKLE